MAITLLAMPAPVQAQTLDAEDIGADAAPLDELADDIDRVPAELRDLLRTAVTETDRSERADRFTQLARQGDGRLVPALEAFRAGLLAIRDDDTLVIYGSRTEVDNRGEVYPILDAFNEQPLRDDNDQPLYADSLGDVGEMLRAARPDRRMLGELISALSLRHPDPERRRRAIVRAGDRADDALLAQLKVQLDEEPTRQFRTYLRESIARIELDTGDRDTQLAAAQQLGEIGGVRGARSLAAAIERATEADDDQLLAVATTALDRVNSRAQRLRWVRYTLEGLSIGSILILMALGLAIIFGLMGVINMAHGEFMMIGAFTTFVVANLFRAYLPPAVFDYYLVVAIPAAFLVAGTVGLLCEKLVIRHLYGRPLETLLATWGIGLILMQSARVWFGDTNRILSPSWLHGNWEVVHDLNLAYNRLFVFIFAGLCVLVTWLVIQRTKMGLLLRATVQDRMMAASLGVSTRRVDGLTFALGTGLAGLAGCGVVFMDNLTPQMGQRYIVDSFLVVVSGGVGNLFGAVSAGLGLGLLNKYIEPFTNAVYAKVIVLLIVIMFLQWRPSGLFAAKGRAALDA
ncbi:urea ABC transporter permease subunit UrtB [Phycisphaerales bacterium AB-hyl4]|uniref:Urea ABC transporter permease subunit UrtB n=1 Tax=Natronomicrosphaera hydrolytica TaxID=3242702 RepID=A0ABV4U773_9BACT